MERYGQILFLSDLVLSNGEVWSNIVPQWPESTKWRGMVKYCTFVTNIGQILYLSDLIVPNGEVWSNIVPQWPDSTKWRDQILYLSMDQILYLSDLIAPNGEVWSNIVPQWPDSTKWRGMVRIKYCTSVTWYYQMERYDQILYLSDLIVPNGEVWSNIIPQWPDSNKWRGINIVPQWPDSTKWGVRIKYCTSVTWEHQMERYDQILYLSDLIVPNGEVGSNIVPQWPGIIKWRGMIKYCTSVTW